MTTIFAVSYSLGDEADGLAIGTKHSLDLTGAPS